MEGAALTAGTVVDRYEIEAPIGEGGMAAVFRVRHVQLGTLHALKVLTVTNRQIRDRLIQEGRLQAALQHPNVVSVTDTIDLGGTPALVMEYVDGPTLDALLREHRLTVAQADELARGILAGVSAAHRAGLVHRDLKPANILLKFTENGFVPKVADFGLAKILASDHTSLGKTRTGSTMGTPHYMSPEQVRDAKNVGTPTDIFALGAILYEMVTSRRAFEGHDLLEIFNAVASGRYVAPTDIDPTLPPRMVQAIARALQIDPAQRPPSVDDLAVSWSGSGAPVAVRSGAFDTGMIQLARSMSQPAVAGVGTRRDTWAGHASVAARQPGADLGGSMDPTGAVARPAGGTSLPDSLVSGRTIALFGIGGTALVLLLSAVLVFGGAAAVVVWLVLSAPRRDLAEPEPLPPPVVDPAPIDWGLDPTPTPKPPSPKPTSASAPLPGPLPRNEPAPAAPQPANLTGPGIAPEPEPEPEPVPEPEPAIVTQPPPAPAPAVVEAPPVATSPDTPPDLGLFLSSSDPAERKKGINHLAARRDPEADRTFVWIVRNEDDSSVRLYAWSKVLERMDAGFADYDILLPLVVEQMSAPERTSLQAIAAYTRYGDDADDLRGALAHSSSKVRIAAVDAVLAVGRKFPENANASALVDPLTRDPDPAVAARAESVSHQL